MTTTAGNPNIPAMPLSQEEAVEQILEEIRSQAGKETRITLIGSRARGTSRPDSDVDIIIETGDHTDDEEDLELMMNAGRSMVASLEARYGLTINANLVDHRESPTTFMVGKLGGPADMGRLETDHPCDHHGMDRCGDCHVCGEHRRLDAWRLMTNQTVLLCTNCYETASLIVGNWRRGDFCPPAGNEAQTGMMEIKPHHQGCTQCFELQPGMDRLLEDIAEHRGYPGGRNINGRMSAYWLSG